MVVAVQHTKTGSPRSLWGMSVGNVCREIGNGNGEDLMWEWGFRWKGRIEVSE